MCFRTFVPVVFSSRVITLSKYTWRNSSLSSKFTAIGMSIKIFSLPIGATESSVFEGQHT